MEYYDHVDSYSAYITDTTGTAWNVNDIWLSEYPYFRGCFKDAYST
jgi:hypothetical protein